MRIKLHIQPLLASNGCCNCMSQVLTLTLKHNTQPIHIRHVFNSPSTKSLFEGVGRYTIPMTFQKHFARLHDFWAKTVKELHYPQSKSGKHFKRQCLKKNKHLHSNSRGMSRRIYSLFNEHTDLHPYPSYAYRFHCHIKHPLCKVLHNVSLV